MKKILGLGAMLVALVSAPAFAELDRDALDETTSAAKQRLNLTEEQTKLLTPVLEKSLESQKAIFAEYGISPSDRVNGGEKLSFREMRALRSDMSAIQKDTMQSVEEILNDEQMAEFKVMQDERRAEVRQRIMGNE